MKIDNSNTSLPLSTEYSDSEVLNYLLQSASINIEDVANEMNKAKLRKILDDHPYAISQHKDGRWRTYVKKENGKRRLIAKATEEEIHIELYKYYQSLSEKASAQNTTVESLFPEWLKYKELHSASSSYITRLKKDWKNHYQGTEIIKIPLSKLNKLSLDTWAHELIRSLNQSKKQYYNVSTIMRQILDYAVDAELLDSNPLKKVKINKKMVFKPEKKKPSETQVFTPEEVDALYKHAEQDFLEGYNKIHKLAPLAVMFQFQTGLRLGELVVVRYEDIVESTIYIQRMFRYEEKELVDYTKGHRAYREVPLTTTAKTLIDMAKSYQLSNNFPSDGYIFSVNDEPLSYYSVRKLYYRYCEKLDTYIKSTHKARKTFISALIDAKVNINEIREIVGHESEKTTFQSYCYDRNTSSERAQQIENALSTTL